MHRDAGHDSLRAADLAQMRRRGAFSSGRTAKPAIARPSHGSACTAISSGAAASHCAALRKGHAIAAALCSANRSAMLPGSCITRS